MNIFAVFRLALVICALVFAVSVANAADDLASFVNPLIGTDNSGNTFPGAVAPFGSVQMTPNWAGSGYYYHDQHMHGFVVNHLSGARGANEGEVLMTATTGDVKIDRASTDFGFDHQHETASAGYYEVLMQPWNIKAELTASVHCGFVKFTFPANQPANVLLPLSYANNAIISSHVRFIDNQTVEGDVDSESFNGEHRGITVYFVMSFSQPFRKHGTWTDGVISPNAEEADQDAHKSVIGFYGSYPASDKTQEVGVRIGVSYTDMAGARANLKAEMPDNDFEQYHQQTVQAWNNELSAIEVKGGTAEHNRIFYTALYHCLLAPQVFDDVDGRYRGFDDRIHQVAEGHQHFYATFAGWGIYRSEMPLLALIAPDRAQDMAQSLAEEAKQIGFIDRGSQRNRPTAIMNGMPNTICVVNIWNAGLTNFDMDTAYDAMFRECMPGDLLSYLTDYQLYEEEKNGITINPDAAVSTALENEVAFAALGNLAKSLGKPRDAAYLFGRSSQYREMYNPATGFLQRRDQEGRWDPGFGGYMEGDEWTYLWFVPQDIQGLIDLVGGTSVFENRLDEFFRDNHYSANNKAELDTPFLCDFISRPWKTQHWVAEAADKTFTDGPGGLAGGNDDLGTLSAWYVFTQLGFYPVDPGIADFEVCTPRFNQITIHLKPPYAGKEFTIQAPDAAPKNEYIQSATLNGVAQLRPWFHESEITGGGTWLVNLGAAPNPKWAALPKSRPYSLSTGYNHLPAKPVLSPLVPTSQENPQIWRYTTRDPGDDWYKIDFADDQWKQGTGGFGAKDSRIKEARTPWNTDNIWLRRTFILAKVPGQPAVLMRHEQDAEVYLNGVHALTAPGSSRFYATFPISPESAAALHAGENVLAVHVHHEDFEAHFADIGLVDIQWSDSEKAGP